MAPATPAATPAKPVKVITMKPTTPAVTTLPPATVATAIPNPTPSPGLVTLAASQGISLADLEALSPSDLAQLQAAYDAGEFN